MSMLDMAGPAAPTTPPVSVKAQFVIAHAARFGDARINLWCVLPQPVEHTQHHTIAACDRQVERRGGRIDGQYRAFRVRRTQATARLHEGHRNPFGYDHAKRSRQVALDEHVRDHRMVGHARGKRVERLPDRLGGINLQSLHELGRLGKSHALKLYPPHTEESRRDKARGPHQGIATSVAATTKHETVDRQALPARTLIPPGSR
jgi:hypothetical protein